MYESATEDAYYRKQSRDKYKRKAAYIFTDLLRVLIYYLGLILKTLIAVILSIFRIFGLPIGPKKLGGI